MALSKRARIWLIVIAIPVVLVIAGIVLLKLMFTNERLKAEVIPRMEEATGRSVSISDVSLGVFPSIALNMDSVRISNREGEGFSDAPMLTLDGLRVNVKLFPLLGGRVEATSLELERPNILIEINRRFETNYEDLVGETETAAAEEAPSGDPSAALALLVSGFRITDGTL